METLIVWALWLFDEIEGKVGAEASSSRGEQVIKCS